MSRVHRAGTLATILVAAVFGLTCTDTAGPRLLPRVSVLLAPVLPPIPNLSGALGITSFRVIIGSPPERGRDTTYSFAPGIDSIIVNLVVPNVRAGEALPVTVQGRAGSTILFSGTTTIAARAAGSGAPPSAAIVNLGFVGPGRGVASIVVAPRDTAVVFGDSARYRATALDSLSATVATFYAVYSSPDTSVRVNLQGFARAPARRGSAWIVGTTPTGIKDSTRLIFVPPPAVVQRISGDAQVPPLPAIAAR